MILVTGASDNHFNSLLQFIHSFIIHSEKDITLIVYNLGIDENRWNELITFFSLNYKNINPSLKIIYKVFDYSKYPSFVNININAGEYAWKPIIIYNTFMEYQNIDTFICWMDSGNIIGNEHHSFYDLPFHNKIIRIQESRAIAKWDNLIQHLNNNGIYSGFSTGHMSQYTHPSTLSFMNCSDIILNKTNRNGACIAFNFNIDWVKSFIHEYYNLCINKNCIAPEGSSRANHRQDQSVFTILFYKYQEIHLFNDNIDSDTELNIYNKLYTIHKDID